MKHFSSTPPLHAHTPDHSGSGKPIAFLLSPPDPSPDGSSSHRVLLVEDQPDVAQATAMVLDMLGATVCVALTGREALERAVAFAPTLVLLDIDLPDISGHEVATRLGAMPELAGVAMVALTSWNTPTMRQRSMEAGLIEHLVKPLSVDGLIALLRRIPVRR